jgi:hypothetical protein
MSRGTLCSVPAPLTITPQQQTALITIELQQRSLMSAAQMLAHPNVNQPEAAKALDAACAALDEAKVKWLQATQHAVQVVSAIPDKLKLVTG